MCKETLGSNTIYVPFTYLFAFARDIAAYMAVGLRAWGGGNTVNKGPKKFVLY